METVSAFIPVDRRHALASRRLLPDRTSGAVLFADISGFTHLTAILAQELGSQRGAEEISIQLDRIFGVMIARVHDYAGSVVAFSGDAITCWFDDNPIGASVMHNGAVRATVCAHAIHTTIDELGGIRTPQGGAIAAGVKVAVAAGATRRFLLGRAGEQRFEVLAGSLVDRTAAAEQILRPGEIAVGAEIVNAFGSALTVKEWRATGGDEPFAILSGVDRRVPPSPWQPIPAIDPDVAGAWLLRPVYERLQSVEGRFLSELRSAVAMFLSFSGINYERDEDAGQKLYDYITWIQTTLARYEGYLLQLVIGDKGSYCFIVFGALHAHEDDPARAVAAAIALNHPPTEVAFIKEVRVGISRGVLHVGAYGSPTRRTFGVIGNETNVAARLMSAAQPGQVLVTSKIARAATRDFQFDDLGDHTLKGLAQPVPVLAVGAARPRLVAPPSHDAARVQVIGRSDELAQLRQKLHALQRGESGAVLIEGDAGIGKSHLLAHFMAAAHDNGVPVLFGAGDAIEQATPYFAWRPIFRAIFGVEEGDAPSMARANVEQRLADHDVVAEHLSLLNTVLPLQIPESALTAQLTGEARANSLHALLLTVLSRLALAGGPIVLAFDDAHWLDSSSAALLAQARRVLQPALFLIVSRPALEGETLQTEYRRLLDAPDVQRLSLNTLSHEQVVQLICQRLGVREIPLQVAAFIYRHSEGHPFFSEEIAFALRDAGTIQIEEDRCRLANGHSDLRNLDFPVTIQGVVTSRIDRLHSSQQLILKVASVLGRIFLVRVLHNIYPFAATLEQLPAQLMALERLDIILRETPPPDLSYIFKHNITQEVIYNLMTFSQRQQLHRNAAQWYESRHAADLAPYYPLLAHHWSRAEAGARAIYYLDKAGEQALRNFANEEAINFYSQALEADAAAGFPTAAHQRALWELKIGEAYVHWTRYAEGRLHLERGLALLGLPTSYTNSTLHNGRRLLAAMLRQLAHRALPRRYLGARQEENATLRAASRAYSRLVEVYFHSGETLRATHAAFHTLNLAELAGDSAELAEAYAPLGAFFSFLRLQRPAQAYLQRALDVANRVNSLPARSFVLLTKATYETGIGDWQEARRSIDELIDTAQRLGAQRRYHDGLQLQTILHYSLADYQNCLEVGRRLLSSARQLNDLRFQGYGLFACAFANFHLGDRATAAAQLQELQALFGVKNGVTDTQLAFMAHGLWCLIHLSQGDVAQALESADAAAQLAEGQFQASYWTLPGYVGAAEAYLTAWELGHPAPDLTQRAAKAVKALQRFARTFPIGKPDALLYAGWRSHLAGRTRLAKRAWQQGLQAAREMELVYDEARLNYEIGRRQLRTAPSGNTLLARAQEQFEALAAVHGIQATSRLIAVPNRPAAPFFTIAAMD